jgi:hypothetical protein
MDASLIKFVRIALEVLSDRMVTILALSMSCGLACYTMWAGDWTRVATLGIFVLFAYLVVQTKEKRHGDKEQQGD